MIHTVGYFLSVTAGATNEQVPALADPVFSRRNSNFVPNERTKLMAAYSSGVSLSRARIVNPSLRITAQPQIVPFNVALLPANDPNVQVFDPYYPVFQPEEEIRVEHTNSLAMGNENEYTVLWLATMDHTLSLPGGMPFWIRATGAITATASAWSALGALTFDDALPAGRYAVCGMQAQGTTIIAARLVFPGQLWRPGTLGQAALGSRTHNAFYGRLGVWGVFDPQQPPQLEVLCNAADTAQVVNMLVIKVR